MRLVIIMKYLQRTKSGIRYRREIPRDLQGPLGMKWFTLPLGETEKEAARNWAAADKAYNKLADNQRKLTRGPSPSELHRMAQDRIRVLGFDPEFDGVDRRDQESLGESHARGLAADDVLDLYPIDEKDGHAVGVSALDLLVVRALNEGMPTKPVPTFDEAQALYVTEKISGGAFEVKKKTQRVERVSERLKAALGKYPRLDRLSREDAKKVRDHMLGLDLAPASVRDVCALLDIYQRVRKGYVELHTKQLGAAVDPRDITLSQAGGNLGGRGLLVISKSCPFKLVMRSDSPRRKPSRTG